MRKLIIEDDEGGTSIVPLGDTSVLLGRLEESTICLNERNISRRHAIIRSIDGRMLIETVVRPELPEPMRETIVIVNGKRISGQVPIEEGDVIRLGDFRISVSEEVEPIERRPTVRFSRPTPTRVEPEPMPADFGTAETLRQEYLTLNPEDAVNVEKSAERQEKPTPRPDRVPDYMLLENIEPPTIEEVITLRLSRTRRLLFVAVAIAVVLALTLAVRAGCSSTKTASNAVSPVDESAALASAPKLQNDGILAPQQGSFFRSNLA